MVTKYMTNNSLEFFAYWMRDNLPAVAGWIGSAFMVAFSFTLVIPLALFGLSCLTYQAVKCSTWNLVALNVISAIGFSLQLIA